MSIRSLLSGLIVAGATFLMPVVTMAQEATEEMIEVVFLPTTPEHGLHAIQDRMKAAGIELTYSDVKYEQEKLVYLGFAVKTSTGSGTATGDITEGKRFGFRTDPRRGVKVHFIVGTLPDGDVEIPNAK